MRDRRGEERDGADRGHVRYDSHSALVVVDVQNDFDDPAGSLYVRGGEELVPLVNEEVRAARAAGAVVAWTEDWHPAETARFTSGDGPWPAHCVAGSWGAELMPGLDNDGLVLRKGTGGEDGYSAFSVRDPTTGEESPTGLAAALVSRGVRRVVVVGIAADYCVRENAIDAVRLGFAATVLAACTRAVDLEADDAERAILAMRAAGVKVV